jgi:hypothetical protein
MQANNVELGVPLSQGYKNAFEIFQLFPRQKLHNRYNKFEHRFSAIS